MKKTRDILKTIFPEGKTKVAADLIINKMGSSIILNLQFKSDKVKKEKSKI